MIQANYKVHEGQLILYECQHQLSIDMHGLKYLGLSSAGSYMYTLAVIQNGSHLIRQVSY